LLGQARAAASLAEAAARFFRSPSDANAFAAAEESKAARLDYQRALPVFRALSHPRRQDCLALSRLLHDCAEESGWAVEEAKRFEAEVDESLSAMAASLRDAVSAVQAALAALGERPLCEARLIEAKRGAGEVERLHRLARADSFDDPNAVSGLKAAAVARRLSQAAEAVSGAADLLGELLVVEAA
jgi:hypothetical protein